MEAEGLTAIGEIAFGQAGNNKWTGLPGTRKVWDAHAQSQCLAGGRRDGHDRTGVTRGLPFGVLGDQLAKGTTASHAAARRGYPNEQPRACCNREGRKVHSGS